TGRHFENVCRGSACYGRARTRKDTQRQAASILDRRTERALRRIEETAERGAKSIGLGARSSAKRQQLRGESPGNERAGAWQSTPTGRSGQTGVPSGAGKRRSDYRRAENKLANVWSTARARRLDRFAK